jgi:hypothetical protein
VVNNPKNLKGYKYDEKRIFGIEFQKWLNLTKSNCDFHMSNSNSSYIGINNNSCI